MIVPDTEEAHYEHKITVKLQLHS